MKSMMRVIEEKFQFCRVKLDRNGGGDKRDGVLEH